MADKMADTNPNALETQEAPAPNLFVAPDERQPWTIDTCMKLLMAWKEDKEIVSIKKREFNL